MSVALPTPSPINLPELSISSSIGRPTLSPARGRTDLYRAQRRDYLVTFGAPEGLLVFVDIGELVRVKSTFQAAANVA
jgi:hypothetical protein